MVEAIEKLIGSSYMLGLIHAEEENPERKINAADETEIPAVPFTEAIQFLKSKVPMSKTEWNKLEPKLRFRAFTVAKLGEAEIVNKAKQILVSALEKGGSYSSTWEELKKKVNVDTFGIKPGYWENVFRTNTQSAYIAGKLQQYENTGVAAYQLMVIEDDRTSKICRHLLTESGYGMILPVGHPFWKKYGFPPYHFQCRTSIRAIWPSQIGKLGNNVENPSMKSLTKFKVQDGFGGNPLDKESWWRMTPSMLSQLNQRGLLEELFDFPKKNGLPSELNELVNDSWEIEKTGKKSNVFIGSKRIEDSLKNKDKKRVFEADKMMAIALSKATQENVYLIGERKSGKNPDCIFVNTYMEMKKVSGNIKKVSRRAFEGFEQSKNVFLYIEQNFSIDDCLKKIHGDLIDKKNKNPLFILPSPENLLWLYINGILFKKTWADVL